MLRFQVMDPWNYLCPARTRRVISAGIGLAPQPVGVESKAWYQNYLWVIPNKIQLTKRTYKAYLKHLKWKTYQDVNYQQPSFEVRLTP